MSDTAGQHSDGFDAIEVRRAIAERERTRAYREARPAPWTSLVTIALFLIAALLLAALAQDLAAAPAFLVAAALLAVVHELGHVVVGLAVGMHVSAVRMGEGPLVATARVRGKRVYVHAVPVSGGVNGWARDAKNLRARLALFAAGGTALALVIGGLGIVLSPSAAIGAGFAWACALNACNLIPVRDPLTGLVSDGSIIVSSLRAPSDVLDAQWVHGEFTEDLVVEDPLRANRAMLDKARRMERSAPNDWSLVTLLLLDDSVPPGERVLTDAEIDRLVVAAENRGPVRLLAGQCINTCVYTGLVAGRAPDPRLVHALRRFHAEHPQDAAVADTLAFAWIVLGDPVEGLVLVQRALEGELSPEQRASVLCVRGFGLAALGRTDEAHECRAAAAELDPSCPLLARLDEAGQSRP